MALAATSSSHDSKDSAQVVEAGCYEKYFPVRFSSLLRETFWKSESNGEILGGSNEGKSSSSKMENEGSENGKQEKTSRQGNISPKGKGSSESPMESSVGEAVGEAP